jgi:hypothetical protein
MSALKWLNTNSERKKSEKDDQYLNTEKMLNEEKAKFKSM